MKHCGTLVVYIYLSVEQPMFQVMPMTRECISLASQTVTQPQARRTVWSHEPSFHVIHSCLIRLYVLVLFISEVFIIKKSFQGPEWWYDCVIRVRVVGVIQAFCWSWSKSPKTTSLGRASRLRNTSWQLPSQSLIYALVIAPPGGVWLIYKHKPRGRKAPEWGVLINQP